MRIVLLVAVLIAASSLVYAADPASPPDPRIALDSAFPQAKAGTRFAGELILVEHVNRRGILRLDRDGTINKYFWDLPHHFQMLPYAAITYHGAPAEFADLPLGTHLHGIFYLGPEGDFKVEPPESGYFAGRMAAPDLRSVVSQYSRVLRFEDDCSYHQRRREGWKLAAFGADKSTVTIERVKLADGSAVKNADDGVKDTQVLRLDRGTRIWKGREIAALEDLALGQIVELNLSWATLLGSTKEDGLCREIWIDARSREVAAEQQRQIHIANRKRSGVPAIILKTESVPGEGARGYVTFAFPAGIDPELIEAFQAKAYLKIWAAEPSLRGWDGVVSGTVQDVVRVEKPPAGHRGVEVRMHLYEMLEGFRAGRTILLAPHSWDPPPRPREDELWPNDTRIFRVGPKPVANRDADPPQGK
ncbi:MAG TPA: hypothetical protein VHV55_01835 [Pirellulales bacterium]|jgi:hypothetical protein|nr:hypothetical protein [Pirellulales bacterium]